MPKILITGSNSFVGTNFIKFSRFREVDEISLFDYVPGKIDFSKYDIILHLVAIVHQTIRIPDDQYYNINCNLTLQVAKEAKEAGVKHFIFMSTVKVYGKYIPSAGVWNESSECLPEDAYGRSKYAAELALKRLDDQNFTISIIRTPLVYGDGVHANMLSIIRLVNTVKILPFKNVNNRRNFTAAENLVAFIDRIIEKHASGIFIAMDKNAISTSDLVMLISRSLDRKIILFEMPKFMMKAGMIMFPSLFDRLYGSYEMDNAKTLELLDFEPPVSINEGISSMIKSFRGKTKI
jgi:UDP-glucose 4-epimerase